MISKPYLLFLGNAKDDLAIKTAAGVNYWRPDWCIGQMSLPNAKSSLGLKEMSIEEAVKNASLIVLAIPLNFFSKIANEEGLFSVCFL